MDIQHFKDKLVAEKARLEQELNSVGRQNPQNPEDWEATVSDLDVLPADENEVADVFEELEENKALLETFEAQLRDVDAALEKIEKGTYGICEVSGEPIEEDRLEANPSARTCKAHMR